MNLFVVSGNLTRDVETRTTKNGKTLYSFTVANSEGFGDKKKTTFFNCTAFGKIGEATSKYASKGSRILVRGSVSIEAPVDSQGQKRYYTNVLVDNVEFLSYGGGESRDEYATGTELEGSGGFNDEPIPF